MRFFFHPAAEAEHLEHVDFYEGRQPGLGARYLRSFDEAMTQVCAAPHRHRIERTPDLRRFRLPGFPFAVIYRQIESQIQVLAVPHLRQRPAYWLARR